MVDGPIPNAIEAVIGKYKAICRRAGIIFNVIRFKNNHGHGAARNRGLELCKNEIVALMDSDDICVSNRFEQQISLLLNDEVDIVGGNIAEFINDEDNIIAHRNVPIKDTDIKRYMKKRCPFNQVTVMFRKSSVMDAGGYLDWYCDEDYYLWIRMALNGCGMANTGTVLCHVRVGKGMYQRRGGIQYFRSEARLQGYMLEHKVISISTYLLNIMKRLVVQVLLPNWLRGWIFIKMARD